MTSLLLKAIPDDVRSILLEEQGKIKKQKGTGMYSLESTIYYLLRDYARCLKSEKK